MSGTTYISGFDGDHFSRDVRKAMSDATTNGYEVAHFGFTSTALNSGMILHAVLIIWRKKEGGMRERPGRGYQSARPD